jgi:uncharacterized protein YlxP (DUF503 family)
MGCGYVGILSVDLHLPVSGSLKGKRKEILRVKHGLTRRFACSVGEVDHHDLWQRARLTVAVVGRTASDADGQVDAARRWLHADEAFQVVGESRELVAVSDEPSLLGR